MKVFTLKPKTHIAAIRQYDQCIQRQVQDLLLWRHQRYCEYQFEQYLLFLDRLFEGYPVMARQVKYSAVFRGFWVNEWAKRDEEWLRVADEYPRGDTYMYDEYLLQNDHLVLLNDDAFMDRYARLLPLVKEETEL